MRQALRRVHADAVVLRGVRLLVDLQAVVRDAQGRPGVPVRERLEHLLVEDGSAGMQERLLRLGGVELEDLVVEVGELLVVEELLPGSKDRAVDRAGRGGPAPR